MPAFTARLRAHLTYSNVVATLALLLALGGTSYAAVKLAPGSVGSRELKANAVTSAKIAAGAVSASDVAANAVTAAKLAAGSVGSGKLADGSVISGKLAAGAVGPGQLADGAVGFAQLSEAVRGSTRSFDPATSCQVSRYAFAEQEPPVALLLNQGVYATAPLDDVRCPLAVPLGSRIDSVDVYLIDRRDSAAFISLQDEAIELENGDPRIVRAGSAGVLSEDNGFVPRLYTIGLEEGRPTAVDGERSFTLVVTGTRNGVELAGYRVHYSFPAAAASGQARPSARTR